jgi:hypothetical protein
MLNTLIFMCSSTLTLARCKLAASGRAQFFRIAQLASLAFDAQNVKMTWLRAESR